MAMYEPIHRELIAQRQAEIEAAAARRLLSRSDYEQVVNRKRTKRTRRLISRRD